MLLALQHQLQAPSHILALASNSNTQPLLRYLHLRYLHVPDDGQPISNAILIKWAASLGVITTTADPNNLSFNSQQMLQLTETVATIVQHDNTPQDPSTSLLTAVAADPSIFTTECQLFPFDLQWIVNAANAAPQQFTPSLDALQVELEHSQAQCTLLQEQDDPSFVSETLDDKLERNDKATSELYDISKETSKMLQEFSQLYHKQLEPLTNIRAPRLGHVGRLSRDLAPRLEKITTLMQELRRVNGNVNQILRNE